MPYFLIQDFSKGLDTRRSPVALPPGSLRYANNCHVTRGGELQKRKAFVPYVTLPPGSVGLAADRDHLIVFGNGAATPGGGVQWVDVGGPPELMIDTTRWSDTALTSILMQDGTVKLMLDDAVITTWNFPGLMPGPVQTYRGKVYGLQGENFYGCALFDPNIWDPADAVNIGSFVIDTSMFSETMAKLNALSVFQGSLALFSEDGIQVWEVDPDPDKNVLTRSLTNTGCLSPRTVLNFGNFDVVFLAKSGIRSLKARQTTDIMNVQDIGTPIDDFVSQLIATLTPDGVRNKAFSIVEPESARLWMSLGDVIMVHSFYEGSEIAAWSTYTPGFQVDGMAVIGSDTFVRSGDIIYRYGGADRTTYDNCVAEVWTPFHHAEKPATNKVFSGFDVACSGEWTIKCATDPRRLDVVQTVGKVTDTTFNEPSEGLANWGTHLSVILECSDAKPSSISNLAMHYTEGAATRSAVPSSATRCAWPISVRRCTANPTSRASPSATTRSAR
jgi:hypothetical protein